MLDKCSRVLASQQALFSSGFFYGLCQNRRGEFDLSVFRTNFFGAIVSRGLQGMTYGLGSVLVGKALPETYQGGVPLVLSLDLLQRISIVQKYSEMRSPLAIEPETVGTRSKCIPRDLPGPQVPETGKMAPKLAPEKQQPSAPSSAISDDHFDGAWRN
ncbi:MAG: hypothetical protein ACYCOU_05905 [Sulfobacillus sp.]